MASRDKNHAGEIPEKNIEEEYKPLADKYKLPSLLELDKEFMIGSLEPGNFPLRVIFVKMAERCDFMLKIMNKIIQPENHLSDMKEAEQLSEAERRKVFELSARLSYFEKEFLIREFDYDESKSAKLILDFYTEWLTHKKDFIGILSSMQQAWVKTGMQSRDYNYFG